MGMVLIAAMLVMLVPIYTKTMGKVSLVHGGYLLLCHATASSKKTGN